MTLRRSTLAIALSVVSLLAWLTNGCGKREVVEPGAVLLHIGAAADAPHPEELRVFVYDDTGVLFDNVRIPASGPLPAPQLNGALGTILVQPRTPQGDLRVHVLGNVGGERILEGTARAFSDVIRTGHLDVMLKATEPRDGDRDDVPDDLDDCPALPNPNQGGCPIDAGAATDAAADGATDAAIPRDAGDAEVAPRQALGTACQGSGACTSGFCVDGVCCESACDKACQDCGTGRCEDVRRAQDAPQCIAPRTCNARSKCVND